MTAAKLEWVAYAKRAAEVEGIMVRADGYGYTVTRAGLVHHTQTLEGVARALAMMGLRVAAPPVDKDTTP